MSSFTYLQNYVEFSYWFMPFHVNVQYDTVSLLLKKDYAYMQFKLSTVLTDSWFEF